VTVNANPKAALHAPNEASEAEKREETSDIAKEIWTALLCANIRQQAYKLGLGEHEKAASGGAGRGGDGKLTFSAPEFDALENALAVNDTTEGAGSSGKTQNHINFQMEAGRLGTIQLSVSRHGTAVSVLVGVIDPIQRALVELEIGSLTQALRNAGLNVGSVRVMHPDSLGIAFAQGRRGIPLQTTDTAVSAYRGSRSRSHTDDEEGLNLVG
jgi:hypothetical protein